MLGCLLSAFLLLAVWDVWVATLTAVALNFAIGALALRRQPQRRSGAGARVAPPPARRRAPRAFDRAADLPRGRLSGLTALGAQVVWTRLLTLLFGATVYAFAIILAVFLAGLGIGSAIASQLLRRGQRSDARPGVDAARAGPALLLGRVLLAQVLPYASPPAWTPVAALHALHVLRAVDVILPGAICGA